MYGTFRVVSFWGCACVASLNANQRLEVKWRDIVHSLKKWLVVMEAQLNSRKTTRQNLETEQQRPQRAPAVISGTAGSPLGSSAHVLTSGCKGGRQVFFLSPSSSLTSHLAVPVIMFAFLKWPAPLCTLNACHTCLICTALRVLRMTYFLLGLLLACGFRAP